MARFLAAAASASGESAAGAAVTEAAPVAGEGVVAVDAGPSSALRFCKQQKREFRNNNYDLHNSMYSGGGGELAKL